MKIGFTYDLRSKHQPDENSPADYYGEYESDETVASITEALKTLGHEVIQIGSIKSLLQFLAEGKRVDLVFNMAEGRYGRARESQVPSILEAYQIPYTFSDPLSLAICLDKGLTKDVLKTAQIPTPKHLVVQPNTAIDLDKVARIGYPIFLKPLYEGTSKGIDENALVRTEEYLITRINWLWETYQQPVLLEKYLPGREFTVGLLGAGEEARVLGVMEIFLGDEKEIYGFAEKEDCEHLVSYRFDIAPPLLDELSEMGLTSWHALECRDGGRVDIRLDENGHPQVIEANTLPGLHPTHSDLPMIATAVGMRYVELLDEILAHAMKRMK